MKPARRVLLLEPHPDLRALRCRQQERLRRVGALVSRVLLTGEVWARTSSPEDVGAVAVLPEPFSLKALLSTLRSSDGRNGREITRAR